MTKTPTPASHAVNTAPIAADLREQDMNAPWLAQAHMLCTDMGIAAGHISDRIEALRAQLAAIGAGGVEPLRKPAAQPSRECLQQSATVRDPATKKPEAGRYVLAWMDGKGTPIRAMWVPSKWLKADDECPEDWAEYDEAEDEYFCPEGWYEKNEHEEKNWSVSTPVVAWMELPRLAAAPQSAPSAPAGVAVPAERLVVAASQAYCLLSSGLDLSDAEYGIVTELAAAIGAAHDATAAPAQAVAVPEGVATDSRWCPDVCPITGREFFMWVEHHDTGEDVPIYGGPFDSYTIPVKDEDGTYSCERYDHDLGGWREWESVGLTLVDDQSFVVAPENPRYDEIRDFSENVAPVSPAQEHATQLAGGAQAALLPDAAYSALQYVEHALAAIANREEVVGGTIERTDTIGKASKRAKAALTRLQSVAHHFDVLETVAAPAQAQEAAPALEAPAAPMTTAEACAALAINSALHRIRAGNAAGAIEPLEQARAALAAAPQAPAAPATVLCYIRPAATLPERNGFEVCRATDAGAMAVTSDGRTAAPAAPAVDAREVITDEEFISMMDSAGIPSEDPEHDFAVKELIERRYAVMAAGRAAIAAQAKGDDDEQN